jgi:hypothetical protein
MLYDESKDEYLQLQDKAHIESLRLTLLSAIDSHSAFAETLKSFDSNDRR